MRSPREMQLDAWKQGGAMPQGWDETVSYLHCVVSTLCIDHTTAPENLSRALLCLIP